MRERSRRFIAALLSAAFLWALALSVSPRLHERLHADANRVDHTCAVTFVSSGSYDHSIAPPPIPAPAPVEFSNVATLHSHWVPSFFLSARIFEHAPPQNS
jgi:hypothetical protein